MILTLAALAHAAAGVRRSNNMRSFFLSVPSV
jgi:hypothetical protein